MAQHLLDQLLLRLHTHTICLFLYYYGIYMFVTIASVALFLRQHRTCCNLVFWVWSQIELDGCHLTDTLSSEVAVLSLLSSLRTLAFVWQHFVGCSRWLTIISWFDTTRNAFPLISWSYVCCLWELKDVCAFFERKQNF